MSSLAVEVKVICLFDADSIAVAKTLSLPDGALVKDALFEMYKKGGIDKPVYKLVKKLRPPLFLVINDEKVEGKGRKIPLADGDTVTVMQIMTGG